MNFYPQKTWLVIVFLVIAGGVLRLPNLGESLWHDEMLYSTKYLVPSLSDLWRISLYDAPAPLYRVLMFFWTTLFGEHELALRTPSLLFGIFSILLVYGIAQEYDSRKAAALAALLLCLSPVHIWYSQEANPYSMAIFFLLATVYLSQRIRTDKVSAGWHMLYLICFLIAVLTHYYTAIFLLPLSILALSSEKLTRRRIIASHCVIVLCLAASLGIKIASGNLISGLPFARPFTFFEWWMLFFNWFSHGNALWSVNPYQASVDYLGTRELLIFFQLIFLTIFLRGLMPIARKTTWKVTQELSLFLFSMPLIMMFLTQVGMNDLYIERYLVFVLPFFLIVLAKGASGFSSRTLGVVTVLFVLTVGVASCLAFYYKSDTWTVYKQNPDWRGAASHLMQETSNSDEELILAVTQANTLDYYLKRKRFSVIPIRSKHEYHEYMETLERGNLKKIYLIKNHSWAGNFNEVFLKMKEDQDFRLVSSRNFKGLSVYLFVPSTPSTSPLATTSQQTGNTLYRSDDSTVQKIGSTTDGSDGTTCQKLGSLIHCN